MDLIISYISDNDISQINVPRYGTTNNIAYEFNIPIYLASQNKKVVVCLPDNFSIKLSYEYMKSLYPMIRIGYADTKNVSYNLSTQIIYITQRYLKYKILQYYQDNTKSENFADVIIMFNPDMNNDNNIFIISAFKYANDNNMLLPELCILNSEYSYKLTENRLFFKNEKIKLKSFHINQTNIFSINKNIADIIKSNYDEYESNFLIYVSNLKTAVSINNTLKVLLPDCKVLIICNDYNNTINTFTDLFNIKTKKIIIAVDFDEFYFENIDFVINVSKISGKQNKSEVFSCYSSDKHERKNSINKEDNIKNISHLIINYIKCDISLSKLSMNSITSKFKNVNLKSTVDLMKNLNLLMMNNDKLVITAAGFFLSLIHI